MDNIVYNITFLDLPKDRISVDRFLFSDAGVTSRERSPLLLDSMACFGMRKHSPV
jgi:hypothetical protein